MFVLMDNKTSEMAIWLLHMFWILSVSIKPTLTEKEYMHEGSNQLYTLTLLYQTSSETIQHLDAQPSKHCEFPNFCDIEQYMTTSRICNHHGTCRFDEHRCHYWCECDQGFTGQKCDAVVEEESEEYISDELADIFNETAFGVVHKDDEYEYEYNYADDIRDWERRSTSIEQMAETCEVINFARCLNNVMG